MSKKDKLIARLKRIPKDFTFDEADTLLGYFGFSLDNKGKTSGSRVMYLNEDLNLSISLHKPHPQKELKEYQVRQLIAFLESEGLI